MNVFYRNRKTKKKHLNFFSTNKNKSDRNKSRSFHVCTLGMHENDTCVRDPRSNIDHQLLNLIFFFFFCVFNKYLHFSTQLYKLTMNYGQISGDNENWKQKTCVHLKII